MYSCIDTENNPSDDEKDETQVGDMQPRIGDDAEASNEEDETTYQTPLRSIGSIGSINIINTGADLPTDDMNRHQLALNALKSLGPTYHNRHNKWPIIFSLSDDFQGERIGPLIRSLGPEQLPKKDPYRFWNERVWRYPEWGIIRAVKKRQTKRDDSARIYNRQKTR